MQGPATEPRLRVWGMGSLQDDAPENGKKICMCTLQEHKKIRNERISLYYSLLFFLEKKITSSDYAPGQG